MIFSLHPSIWDSMDEPGGHFAKRSKPTQKDKHHMVSHVELIKSNSSKLSRIVIAKSWL